MQKNYQILLKKTKKNCQKTVGAFNSDHMISILTLFFSYIVEMSKIRQIFGRQFSATSNLDDILHGS